MLSPLRSRAATNQCVPRASSCIRGRAGVGSVGSIEEQCVERLTCQGACRIRRESALVDEGAPGGERGENECKGDGVVERLGEGTSSRGGLEQRPDLRAPPGPHFGDAGREFVGYRSRSGPPPRPGCRARRHRTPRRRSARAAPEQAHQAERLRRRSALRLRGGCTPRRPGLPWWRSGCTPSAARGRPDRRPSAS